MRERSEAARSFLQAPNVRKIPYRRNRRNLGGRTLNARPLSDFDSADRLVDTFCVPSPHTIQQTVMPTGQPPCPKCQDNLFVRVEQIISGRRVMQAFYCGRCNHEWRVENRLWQGEDRRQGERRKREVRAQKKGHEAR
jgi:hypothetical protein